MNDVGGKPWTDELFGLTKNLTEMTSQELREEIGRLNTVVSRLTEKNKRRKRALKQMNVSVLIKHKVTQDALKYRSALMQRTALAEQRAEVAESQVKYLSERMTERVAALEQAEKELEEMAKYAHGREMQAMLAGFNNPPARFGSDEQIKLEKRGFFRRLFARNA